MSALRLRKPGDQVMFDQEQWSVISKTHQRRWRKAFQAICFTRALVSLSKKVIDKNGPLLRTLSYVAIDMQPSAATAEEDFSPGKPVSFPNVDPKILSDMVRDKNIDYLNHFGGVNQLVVVLESDVKHGIYGSDADVIRRRNFFGANNYQKKPPRSFLSFVIEALKDTTIIILLACAVLSLVFGIKEDGWKDGWYDGGSIIVAVILVVAVSAVSNFKQSKQFEKLSTKRSDIKVEVVRDGRRQPISIFEIVVGDIVCLKIGDQIPADGLFLEGHSLMVDESSMTGESDHVEIHETICPFLLSGTKVILYYNLFIIKFIFYWLKM
jgi:Ca2+-transporting ATPase